jgi:hypothetical protein
MASLNRFQFTLVLFGLLALFFGTAQRSGAETLIYSNTNLQGGYYWSPSYYGYDVGGVDYGTSTGGDVCRIKFGYYSAYNPAGWIEIRFYKYTDYYTDPEDSIYLKKFFFDDLPGGGSYIYEYKLTKDDQFKLPAGDFGYSFDCRYKTEGTLLASGGLGNDNCFWVFYEDWLSEYWTYFSYIGGYPYAGFYLEIYEGEIIPDSLIKGYKFEDIDSNGSWDDGEPTLPGWEIFLDMNNNGTFDYGEPNCITDPNGMYEFNPAEPGSYSVGEVLKDGWVQTCPGGNGLYPVVVDVNEVFIFNFGNYEGELLLELSGHVLTDEDEPVEDVLMSANTGQSTMTDEFGYYELMLPAPWSGIVTPSKECFTFDPAQRTYSGLSSNLADQDFTAMPSCFYGGGSGTEGDPYLIVTAEHMQEIGTHPEHWASHFKLMNDIDLAAYTGDSFNMIGWYVTSVDNHPFTGVFDGNNHRIYNFTYIHDASLAACIGLFGHVDDPGAEIKNLTLVEPLIEAEECFSVGPIVGGLGFGTVSYCAVLDGTVVGNGNVGGLVGTLFDGIVLDSYTRCTVGGNESIGGLIGYNGNELLRCYSVSDVSGSYEVGAIIGNNDGTPAGCFYDSDISVLPGVGSGDTSGVIGETTENMQAETTFTDEGWDFATVWDICEGTNYPKFLWHELPVADLVCPDGVEVADFAIISAYWLQNDCGLCGGADLSGDGDVGLPDVEILVENWMMGVGI